MYQKLIVAILMAVFLVADVILGKTLLTKPSSEALSSASLIRFSECFFNIDELCKYDGELYNDLEKWHTDDCLECTCYGGIGVMCCNKVWYPVDWPSHCMPLLKRKECRIKLVEKKDATQECWEGDNELPEWYEE